jgi:RNA polymerase sigma-70 factor (ECF subfamily)
MISQCFGEVSLLPDNKKDELLARLYLDHHHAMFNVAFSILCDKGLSEDAVQISFLKLVGKTLNIKDMVSKDTTRFLMAVVRNTAIDLYRKRKKQAYVSHKKINRQINYSNPPLEQVISNEDRERIHEIIYSLDHKYANVITLRFICDLSYDNISDLLGISNNTVRVRLHRAKKLLAKKLTILHM